MGRSRSRGRHSRSHSRSRSRSRSFSPEGFRVHVADLGLDPSKREIEKCFAQFGSIMEIWVARSPPCFAFVVYKHKESANTAIRDMDGQVLSGGRVRVTHARPRNRGGRKMRDFDTDMRCFSCGERGHFARDCDMMSRPHFEAGYKRRSFSRSRSHERSRRSPDRSRRSPSPDRSRRSPSPDRSRRSPSPERSRGRQEYSRDRRSRSRERNRDTDRDRPRRSRDSRSPARRSRTQSHRSSSKSPRRRQSKETRSPQREARNGERSASRSVSRGRERVST